MPSENLSLVLNLPWVNDILHNTHPQFIYTVLDQKEKENSRGKSGFEVNRGAGYRGLLCIIPIETKISFRKRTNLGMVLIQYIQDDNPRESKWKLMSRNYRYREKLYSLNSEILWRRPLISKCIMNKVHAYNSTRWNS